MKTQNEPRDFSERVKNFEDCGYVLVHSDKQAAEGGRTRYTALLVTDRELWEGYPPSFAVVDITVDAEGETVLRNVDAGCIDFMLHMAEEAKAFVERMEREERKGA